jgi:hypothetical protein
LSAPTLVTPLPFPLLLKDGTRLAVVGDAVIYFTRLSEDRRQIHYWQRAIMTFNAAAKESAYLRTATICLETALQMDNLLADPPSSAKP